MSDYKDRMGECEQVLLDCLKSMSQAPTALLLIETARRESYSKAAETDLRRTLWSMLNRGILDMTHDRRIVLCPQRKSTGNKARCVEWFTQGVRYGARQGYNADTTLEQAIHNGVAHDEGFEYWFRAGAAAWALVNLE